VTERTTFYELGVRIVHRSSDRSVRVETIDIAQLQGELGEAMLCAFLRLFVWADRLQSLADFGALNAKQHGGESVRFHRNLQTITWFISGSLFEAAEAVHQLRTGGVEARIPDSAKWPLLMDMATRWTTLARLRRLRNNVGFHVDPRVMADGLAACAGERLTIFTAEAEVASGQSLRLGLEVLLRGMPMLNETRMGLDEFDAILHEVGRDYQAFSGLVQDVFIEVLQGCGALPR
jgi:hypothetical protein